MSPAFMAWPSHLPARGAGARTRGPAPLPALPALSEASRPPRNGAPVAGAAVPLSRPLPAATERRPARLHCPHAVPTSVDAAFRVVDSGAQDDCVWARRVPAVGARADYDHVERGRGGGLAERRRIEQVGLLEGDLDRVEAQLRDVADQPEITRGERARPD